MAENKFRWSVAVTKVLISEYEGNEFLYNSVHPDYKNRNKRLEAYQRIAESIKTISQGCTVDDVQKKLNGLRSQYLAEKMKVIRSLKSGAEGDDVYKLTVYWFPLLQFLDKSTDADESQSNLDPPPPLNEPQTSGDMDADVAAIQDEQLPHTANKDSLTCENSLMTEKAKHDKTFLGPKNKKKKSDSYDAVLVQASNAMAEFSKIVKDKPTVKEPDSLDSFGQFVVTELRGIRDASNDYMVRQAKRKIQNVLMETWDIIDQPPMPPSPLSPQGSSQSGWPATPQSGNSSGNSAGYQPYDNNVNDLVNNALLLANITRSDCIDNFQR